VPSALTAQGEIPTKETRWQLAKARLEVGQGNQPRAVKKWLSKYTRAREGRLCDYERDCRYERRFGSRPMSDSQLSEEINRIVVNGKMAEVSYYLKQAEHDRKRAELESKKQVWLMWSERVVVYSHYAEGKTDTSNLAEHNSQQKSTHVSDNSFDSMENRWLTDPRDEL